MERARGGSSRSDRGSAVGHRTSRSFRSQGVGEDVDGVIFGGVRVIFVVVFKQLGVGRNAQDAQGSLADPEKAGPATMPPYELPMVGVSTTTAMASPGASAGTMPTNEPMRAVDE